MSEESASQHGGLQTAKENIEGRLSLQHVHLKTEYQEPLLSKKCASLYCHLETNA